MYFQALSGASYDYMKVCVYELKKQLTDLESSGNQSLMQDAMKTLPTSLTSSTESSASSSNHSGVNRRRNPFNTEESSERESQIEKDRQTIVEKQARTFLQMHAELKEQVVEIRSTWLLANPTFKPDLLINDSIA